LKGKGSEDVPISITALGKFFSQDLQRRSAALKQMQGLPKLTFMILVETNIITASTLPEVVAIWGLNVDIYMQYRLIKMKRGQ